MEINYCKIGKIIVYPEITNRSERSQSFLNWTEGITYKENMILLPDGTEMDGKIWMNVSLQFDNGSYTNFLENYFNG